MSDPERLRANPDDDRDTSPSQGPSLTLIYTLVALALVAATAIALFIVLPFYHRR